MNEIALSAGRILPYYVLGVSVLSFFITVFDKLAARVGWRRVPEKRFVLAAALGGGAGVLAGFYLVRHKTRHRSLLAAVWLWSVGIYAALTALLIWIK